MSEQKQTERSPERHKFQKPKHDHCGIAGCGCDNCQVVNCGQSRDAEIHQVEGFAESHRQFQSAEVVAFRAFDAPQPPPDEAALCGECLHPESAHGESGCVGMVEPEHCGCRSTFPAPEVQQVACSSPHEHSIHCSGCAGVTVAHVCGKAPCAVQVEADTRIVFEHGNTGPCSACGDGDTAQQFHKHVEAPAVDTSGLYGVGGDIVFYAFRYCLGRQTYVVNDCVKYLIENWQRLPTATAITIQNDIRKHFKRVNKDVEPEWQILLDLPLPTTPPQEDKAND